jgi:hypothetical protein
MLSLLVLVAIPLILDGVKHQLKGGKNARKVILTHLRAQIGAAIKLVEESCGNDDPATRKLMKFFQESKVFTKSTLVATQLKRPTPDKVFCEVEQDSDFVLIPASNAIGIVLKHGLTKEPSLDELEALIKTKI